jgi:hypothetical protein
MTKVVTPFDVPYSHYEVVEYVYVNYRRFFSTQDIFKFTGCTA